jgi:hypothetical protein
VLAETGFKDLFGPLQRDRRVAQPAPHLRIAQVDADRHLDLRRLHGVEINPPLAKAPTPSLQSLMQIKQTQEMIMDSSGRPTQWSASAISQHHHRHAGAVNIKNVGRYFRPCPKL